MAGTKTTFFTCSLDEKEVLMTGEETYPTIGGYLSQEKADEIIKKFQGLNKYWDCIKKAEIAQRELESGTLVLGSMKVWNDHFNANYGFEYNPPLEFHTWLEIKTILGKVIYDLALLGVIERGLKEEDEYGKILEGRKPIILAGFPPNWLEYSGEEYYVLI